MTADRRRLTAEGLSASLEGKTEERTCPENMKKRRHETGWGGTDKLLLLVRGIEGFSCFRD